MYYYHSNLRKKSLLPHGVSYKSKERDSYTFRNVQTDKGIIVERVTLNDNDPRLSMKAEDFSLSSLLSSGIDINSLSELSPIQTNIMTKTEKVLSDVGSYGDFDVNKVDFDNIENKSN